MSDASQTASPGSAVTVQAHAPDHPAAVEGWVDVAQIDVGVQDGYEAPSVISALLPWTQEWRRPVMLAEIAEWGGECHLPTWPPFLLDLLPQWGRTHLCSAGPTHTSGPGTPDTPDSAALQLQYLLTAAGSPIGNLRIEEAALPLPDPWALPGWTDDEIHDMDRLASEIAPRLARDAPGAFGLQGAWPKFLVTRSNMDGLWYPDPLVPDGNACCHSIVKWGADRSEVTEAILSSEAPYVALAGEFGLRSATLPRYRGHVLLIPRFDRRVLAPGQVTRFAQQSIASASGRIGFGVYGTHETYLATIKRRCTDVRTEVIEYVLRDVFNLATGNTDNHGRNTSLRVNRQGQIQLSPVYDVCPQGLALPGERRATEWACEQEGTQPPDWHAICEVAADGVLPAAELRAILASKAPFLRELQDRARRMSLASMVVDHAMAGSQDLARTLAALA